MSETRSNRITIPPSELLKHPNRYLKPLQNRWLRPLDASSRFAQAGLYYVNWLMMRILFRLTVEGAENIPSSGSYILAPNHTSSLDPCAIAAAVSLKQFRSLRWAAREDAVTGHFLRERVARLGCVIPIERSIRSLAAASAVLDQGENLVWFPEGTRSESGELQPLRPGIGYLACHRSVPVIPVITTGAHSAMPPPRKTLRRLSKINVRFCVAILTEAEKYNCVEAFMEKLQDRMQVQISARRGTNER